ncbi:MAG: glycoside hydrolase family 127 protein, partial [Planctomycetia bacterium]|nr:glycoside hydrolase family 127 protein [Planctomycetia bacterium]
MNRINLGLVRNYRTTGNLQSLKDAKIMGDYILRTFPTEENGFYDPAKTCTAGLPEGFLELYRVTGEKKYLDFATNVRHGNSYGEVRCEALCTWKQDFKTRPCHVYVMLARTYAQTELYRLTGTDSLMDMSHFMKQEMLEKGRGALLIPGSTSQGEHMTYNQDGAGNIQESCVTAYLLRWFDCLMRLEGDMRYGDIMERTIYNALFAAQEPSGRRISYYLCFTGPRTFQTIDTFCCNGNYRRAVAELPQKVYYRFKDDCFGKNRTRKDGIALNLFTESEKTFDVVGKSVTIRQETDCPTDFCRFRIG